MNKYANIVVKWKGDRLDRFLACKLPKLSRSRIQQLITQGFITVDGLTTKSSVKLKTNQIVVVNIPASKPSGLLPQAIPLNVIFEDPDIVVIDKPAGLSVHPGPGHPDKTIVNAILALVPDLTGIGGTIRPGIVHRLDKNTSGLLVIAKNEDSHKEMSRQFKERLVKKNYLALVHGKPNPHEAVIDAPIGRHPKNRKRMAVVNNGKKSTTSYRTLEQYDDFTLLEIKPASGRTHQIRVHMSAVGHPLFGDTLYGKSQPVFNRHFLHANLIRFQLPSTSEYVELESDLPSNLVNILNSL